MIKFHCRDLRRKIDQAEELLSLGRLSRREFIRRGSVLGLSAIVLNEILGPHLHAIADESSKSVLEKIKAEGGQLFVYNWEAYLHPDTIPNFEKEFGVKVTLDTFPSNEHLLTKLQGNAVDYDIIFPSHNYLPILTRQGLLAPIDLENIPNKSGVMPRFLDTPFDPGNHYSIPYNWGMTGIGYNALLAESDPNLDSWALIFESGPLRYSGKLGFTDEREEVLAAALKYLGYSANTKSRGELELAGDVLTKVKPHVKAYYPGTIEKKALILEDVAVGHCWNGEIVMAHWKNPLVRWMLPKEGGTGWFDTMAIPKTAKHKFTAETFINYMHRPKVAGDNSNVTGYATSNGNAIEHHVKPKIARNPAIYPTEKELERVEFLAAINDDLLPIYDDIWTKLLGN